MAVWECAECTTKYAVGAPKCPHCGSVVRVDERTREPEEEETDVAKVTVHSGPSNEAAGEPAGEDVSASSEAEQDASEPSKSPARARKAASRSKKTQAEQDTE
jgi:predicted ATP-dependent serine protease